MLDRPISYSDLRAFSQSARHFQAQLEAPREVTAAMRVGTATHRLVLGGPAPSVYDGTRTAKWKAETPDYEEVLNGREYALAEAMATSVLSHPTAREYLDGARYEVPLEWEYAGVRCWTRGIDILHPTRLGDLKTMATVAPAKAMRHAESMLYHAQIGWYDLALDILGYPPRSRPAFLLCVESKPPHDVVVLELEPDTLAKGRQCCHAWLEQYKVARESGAWPGYTVAPVPWALYSSGLELDDEEDA